MKTPKQPLGGFEKEDFWIISPGRYTDLDLSLTGIEPLPRHVRSYRISELARYMLSSDPVEIRKRLVGCEIHHAADTRPGFGNRIRGLLGAGKKAEGHDGAAEPKILLSQKDSRLPAMTDADLERHFQQIDEMLKPHDPALKRLYALQSETVSDIVGICEDPGGSRSLLTIQGTVDDKIAYMMESMDQPVGIVIEKAHIAEGLYDMSGFDFTAFDPARSFHMLRFLHEGTAQCCVLGESGRIDFWVEPPQQVHQLLLLQQSIATDGKMAEPFRLCLQGKALALKIFFNPRLEIDYTKAHFPAVYREVIESHAIEGTGRKTLMGALNAMQLGIAFTYVPGSESGEEKLFTSLSVMHDIKALEPIREKLPQIYSAITQRACVSEIGRFYLLDSIKGYKDVIGLQTK